MRRQVRRPTVPTIVVSCVLVIFSATGLLAGGVASSLAAGSGSISHAPTQTPTRKVTPSASSASASSTPVSSTQLVTNAFALTLSIAPNPATTTKPLQVTVKATSQTSGQPMAGVLCQLQAPRDGSHPLLANWPPAKATDGSGSASWALDLSRVQAGAYTIGVTSVGTSYTYHSEISVTVVRSS